MNDYRLKIRRSRTSSGGPHPVDIHVGLRIRLRRILLGLSQEKLGVMMGMTFQQIQKYEHGANRICASRLFQVAGILDVPISYFFDGLPGGKPMTEAQSMPHRHEDEAFVFEKDHLKRRETLALARSFCRILDPAVRKRIVELTQSVATLY